MFNRMKLRKKTRRIRRSKNKRTRKQKGGQQVTNPTSLVKASPAGYIPGKLW